MSETLSLTEIEALAFEALVAAGTSTENARSLAIATADTEAMGVASHGLAYIPIYAQHVQCGKVDGIATPILSQPKPSVINVDAATGFAHPAIALGFSQLVPLAKQQGIAILTIKNSYNCGVLGVHTKKLAEAGLLGIGFTNAPASIAPSGGHQPVVGTNPFSIAAPDENGNAAILIDQSASTIAKSEVMKYAREGKPVPEGWVLDMDGNPTTDPDIGLKGSMAPSGGYKGAGVAMMVEIMAAALTGAHLGIEASPFSGPVGGPPKTGQCFIAIDPTVSSGSDYFVQLSKLITAVTDQDARLPGRNRTSKQRIALASGVEVNSAILEKIQAMID